MNHQLFEKWLLNKESLAADQRSQLKNHLKQCEKCRALAASWEQAESQLSKVKYTEPRPGFSKRWLSSLAERRQLRTRNLVKTWLFGLGGAALLSLVTLIVISASTSVPSGFTLGIAQIFQRISILFQQVRNFLFIIVNKAPYISWLALAVTGIGLLTLTALVWILITTRNRRESLNHES